MLEKGMQSPSSERGVELNLIDLDRQTVPFVSVIIPTRNEEKYIGKCLESLANQTYAKDKYEVLIVDGLSRDRTLEIAEGYRDKLGLRILQNSRIKHVFALNLGIKESKGDYFAVIGGHSFVEKDFLEKSVQAFFKTKKAEPNLAGVGGGLKMLHNNTFSRLVSALFRSPFSGASSFWYSQKPHFARTVVFGFYDKKTVVDVGGFDEDMIKGQDFEINLRLGENGYRLYHSPDIKPYYYVRDNFMGFVRQAFDNGVAKSLCIKKGYFMPVWLIPSLFFAYQLFLPSAFFLKDMWQVALLVTPFAVYWLASILASMRVAQKWKDGGFLPFMFWLLHTITGVGFLTGVILGKKVLNM